MNEKDDEAAAWAICKDVANSAINFTSGFLGLRKGGADVKLVTSDLARLLDIVRAVSWVESKHGTGVGEKPKVDPVQCGNPRDVWWKEIAGQTNAVDRFVRGPGLSNLDANDLPNAADNTAGFSIKASLTKLGTDAKKGHNAATFAIEHRYFWALPILIHKTNTNSDVNEKTYQCGDLSRIRLITGGIL